MDAKDAIREFIRREFPAAGAKPLADDERLLESGIIDSVGVFELARFIEKRFGVTFDRTEFTVQNFSTIAALAAVVESKRRA